MGLESGRYDASDDHRISEEMRARAHAYTFPVLDDVRPLPDGHQELVDRIRLSKKVQGALTSAAHYLTAPDYEKMLKLIEDAAPNKSKVSPNHDYPENNVQIGES